MRGTKPAAPVAAAAGMALLLGSGFGTLSARQAAAPPQAPPAAPACGGRSSNPRTACPDDVAKMMAALPSAAPAKPTRSRKVLILARAAGWVHSSIPLAAKTVEALGAKTGAWASTLTYEAADINAQNLAQYDAIVLDNTTGCFLDDANDAAATAARRAALLDFIRGGKGIAAIHAASDSYHGNACGEAVGAPSTIPGGLPLWPEWNTIIGGYFKWHWNDPQLITVKIDDPKSPLTAMFKGAEFEIHDETYTYNDESFSRANVHVLTSVNYEKMSAEDKQKEPNPRADHDYALSWIRDEGKGRVFYEAHGHGERIYAMTPMLEHLAAGIQYAIGDLKADATPAKK
jgi:type 1 glutamine amidotransferase